MIIKQCDLQRINSVYLALSFRWCTNSWTFSRDRARQLPRSLDFCNRQLLAKLREINRLRLMARDIHRPLAGLFDTTQLSTVRSCIGRKLINAPLCTLRTYRDVLILIQPPPMFRPIPKRRAIFYLQRLRY